MYREKFSSLGVRALGQRAYDTLASLKQLEEAIGISLPEYYRGMLLEYAGPIVFEEANSYKPLQPSPYDREDGTQSIEVLYGLGPGDYGLMAVYNAYSSRIPEQVLPIGSVPGGSQICLCLGPERTGQVYLWEHEDEREITGEPTNDFGNMYLIARSLEAFVQSIEPEDESPAPPDIGVVRVKLDI